MGPIVPSLSWHIMLDFQSKIPQKRRRFLISYVLTLACNAWACRETSHSLPSQFEPPPECRSSGPLMCMRIHVSNGTSTSSRPNTTGEDDHTVVTAAGERVMEPRRWTGDRITNSALSETQA